MIDQDALRVPAELRRYQTPALVVGVIALAVLIVGAFFSPTQFFRSYLMAFVFWTGLALGCLGILMMQYLTGGAWGIVIRRQLESATRTLPLMALLFIPLAFGVGYLYIWSHPGVVAANHTLQQKKEYLNIPFFLVRAAVYFLVWIGAAWFLNRWSWRQDQTADPTFSRRLQRLSGPGLFVLSITLTFAMIDWVMSLEPLWYSTIYGVTFMAGVALAAYAFTVATLILLARYRPLAGRLRPRHYRDLGNLMLAFVMVWAYCSFAQYLLIWSGNLREEIPWYLRRIQGGWGWVAVSLIAIHFFLPFFLLMSRTVKRDARWLMIVALIVILMRFVDVFWLVEPAFYEADLRVHWMDFAALIGFGGLWLAVFVWQLRARPLLPLNDPYLREAFEDAGEQ
jgi:hypothetical protein